jgi:putative phage-type endonuclease
MNTRYVIHHLEQGSQDWIYFRKGKIGASMAPVIMGVSPFQTKLQLWEEFIFDTEKPKTRAMTRGTELEEKARQWINKSLNREYKPVVLQSINNPEFIASLDGYYEDEDGKPQLLEIKCPGQEAHLLALEGKIPDYYYPQLQHQMDLAGVDEMLYVSFDGEDGKFIFCERDEHYCAELFAEELAFFASVISFRPPEPSDRDEVIINDPMAILEAEEYAILSAQLDEIEKRMSEVKQRLIAHTTNSRSKIGNLKIQKVIRRGLVDYSKIPQLREINLDLYRKPPTDSWRISID